LEGVRQGGRSGVEGVAQRSRGLRRVVGLKDRACHGDSTGAAANHLRCVAGLDAALRQHAKTRPRRDLECGGAKGGAFGR